MPSVCVFRRVSVGSASIVCLHLTISALYSNRALFVSRLRIRTTSLQPRKGGVGVSGDGQGKRLHAVSLMSEKREMKIMAIRMNVRMNTPSQSSCGLIRFVFSFKKRSRPPARWGSFHNFDQDENHVCVCVTDAHTCLESSHLIGVQSKLSTGCLV